MAASIQRWMKSGSVGDEPVEIEALEDRQLLQHHRPLRPGPRLQHGIAAVVERQRRLDGRQPGRHVLRRQHALVAAARDVHHLLRAAEPVDRLGDEALAPGLARALDLGLAAAAAGLGLLQDALVGLGVLRDCGTACPASARCRRADRRRPRSASARWNRSFTVEMVAQARSTIGWPFRGIADRRLQHVAQPHGAVVAQHQHEGLERARDAGGEQPGARE